MKKVEYAPFQGKYKGLGGTSCDSAVGILKADRDYVVKWNRRHIPTEEEARRTSIFVKKSIDLYRAALGEFILPTSVILGAKKDGGIPKYKVYTVQPYIDGWTAKFAPDEVRNNVSVMDQWNILNSRLFHLYNVAQYINREVGLNPSCVFPVTLTLGPSRRRALLGVPGGELPNTPNLLIDKKTYSLGICDFGEYIAWNENMNPAYVEILERVKRK